MIAPKLGELKKREISDKQYSLFINNIKSLKENKYENVIGRAFAIASHLEIEDLNKMKISGRIYPKVRAVEEFIRLLANENEKLKDSMFLERAKKYGLPSSIYMSQDSLKKHVNASSLENLATSQLYNLCFEGYHKSGELIANSVLSCKEKEYLEGEIRKRLIEYYRVSFAFDYPEKLNK